MKPVEGQKPPPPFPEGPERDAFAEQAFGAAQSRLEEVESLQPDKHGRSIAHGCYYCLFWLARAIIILRDGTYPWRHDSTETHLQEIVAAADDENLVEAYRLYRDAAFERAICDYDSSYRPSPERAREVFEGTQRAFEAMSRKLELQRGNGYSGGP